MNRESLSGRIASRFGRGAVSDVSDAAVTADVPARRWIEALTFSRDELGCTTFDWLSAVDELTDGVAVIVHVCSPDGAHLLLRTRVSGHPPRLPTTAGIYGSAAAHERDAARMFGIQFDGHPDLSPLLLPESDENPSSS